MERNLEIYFEEDFDKKYLEFIESKNTLSFKYINLFYEFLSDILKDDGENLKTWIGVTNFRKYIFEINHEKEMYNKQLHEYIKSNNISDEKSETIHGLRLEVEEKIEKLNKYFIGIRTKIISSNKTQNKISNLILKDFFTDKIGDDKILEIQSEFKFETGKQMAILIHFLEEKGLLKIDNNDRKGKSRLWFVRTLTGQRHLKQINSISNYLGFDNELKNIGKQDKQYIRIEKKINELLKYKQDNTI